MSTYDDFSSPAQMHADCREAGRHLGLVTPAEAELARAARAAVQPPPSIHFEDYPREVRKRGIEVSDAAQRLANALHLHLD